jgi:amino acid adenylation domain-containing protein
LKAPTIIDRLSEKGILLDLAGDDLRCRAPRGSLTPELRDAIAAEKPAIITLLRRSRQSVGHDSCLHHLFEAQAETAPEAIAILCGGREFTYRWLNDRARQLAAQLRTRGVGPDVTVGLSLERSVELVVGMLGILMAGGAYVPIDPETPAKRREVILRSSRAAMLLTQESMMAELNDSTLPVLPLDRPIADEQPGPKFDNSVRPDNLAYVIHTSGSTGTPKGVMVSHRAVRQTLAWWQSTFHLRPSDRIIQTFSYAFDASVWEFFGPLSVGACLVLPPHAMKKDIGELARQIAEHEITVCHMIPTPLRLLLDEPVVKQYKALRLVFCGGEALTAELAEKFRSRLDVELVNLYGPTEAAIVSTYWRCDRENANANVPIGGPISGKEVYVLDERLHPVSIGVPGELYVGGPGLARGYMGVPALTAEKFIPHPFAREPGQRLYRTGDRCRWTSEGVLEYLGRFDRQVKLRGYRIELGEIESVLLSHPSVNEAAVIVSEKAPGDGRIVAYVALNADDVSPDTVKEYVSARLPAFMLPSSYIPVERMPRTASGKLDRRSLPRPDAAGLQAAYVAPSSETELALAGIWSQILQVERVGVRDNFFDLGGHSLTAVRLAARIEEEFRQPVPLALIFQEPTIEGLARALINDFSATPTSAVLPLRRTGTKRPLFCVHPASGLALSYIDLAQNLDQEQPVYAFQSVGLGADVVLHSSIEEMAAHYCKLLRKLDPVGPYNIAGHSFGGLVAYEMAQQLAAAGHPVSVLALLDAAPTRAESDIDENHEAFQDNARWLLELVKGIERFTGVNLQVDELQLRDLGFDQQLSLIESRLQNTSERNGDRATVAGTTAADTVLQMFQGGGDIVRTVLAITKANVMAARKYRARPYAGNTVLFTAAERAGDGGSSAGGELPYGWNKFIAASSQVFVTPGDHFSMITAPHVTALASTLQDCLNKVHGDETTSLHTT